MDKMEDNREIFVYLGRKDGVHYFSHTVHNKMDLLNIHNLSGQIYNCMIHNKMIKKNEKVIVFNIWNMEIHCTLITHIDTSSYQYNINDFENNYMLLLANRGDTIMSFQYNGEYFNLCTTPYPKEFKDKKFTDDMKPKIKDVQRIVTTKTMK